MLIALKNLAGHAKSLKGRFFLIAAFLLTFHPSFLGSETLTMTTYYPAPYGGYTSILVTGDTLLASDAARRVGIGTTSPGYKLDINGPANVTGTMSAGDVRVRINSTTTKSVVTIPECRGGMSCSVRGTVLYVKLGSCRW